MVAVVAAHTAAAGLAAARPELRRRVRAVVAAGRGCGAGAADRVNAVRVPEPVVGVDPAAEAAALARTLGQVWQASPTAGLYAITADADFEAHFGKKAAKRRKIYNGMIPCQIYMYFDRPVKPVRK